MIQSGLIQNAHSDLVTDASYDFYGLRLATCSLDQRIKIWKLDEDSGIWKVEDDWKAHDAPISKISWAHPEFGPIIASGSFDRTVKIWEQVAVTRSQPSAGSPSRWTERASLVEARGTVRSVEFSPHHFGLKLATISTDNYLRVYECLEQPALTTWQLVEEIDVLGVPSATSASSYSRAHTVALSTPTQTNATLEGASASLVAQALQQGLQQSQIKNAAGSREADGGWCISWCKDRYWGEVIAAGCSTSGVVKIIQLSPSRRAYSLLTLDPYPTLQTVESIPSEGSSVTTLTGPTETQRKPYAITSTSWAPSCGRSYHLIAAGSRDGRVRIWKVKPILEDDEEEQDERDEEAKWTATMVADFDDHKSSVGRVEWNITGTILSSAGNDGRVRLWKATSGGSVWRPAGSVGVEQADSADPDGAERMEEDIPVRNLDIL